VQTERWTKQVNLCSFGSHFMMLRLSHSGECDAVSLGGSHSQDSIQCKRKELSWCVQNLYYLFSGSLQKFVKNRGGFGSVLIGFLQILQSWKWDNKKERISNNKYRKQSASSAIVHKIHLLLVFLNLANSLGWEIIISFPCGIYKSHLIDVEYRIVVSTDWSEERKQEVGEIKLT
jgi:hypothetical protein